MLLEVLQNYMDIVNGATRITQRNATAIARSILIQAGMEPAADMVTRLSEQMIAAQEAQYMMVRQMIQSEVELTMQRMGVAQHVMGREGSVAADAGERTPTRAPSAPPAPTPAPTPDPVAAEAPPPVPEPAPAPPAEKRPVARKKPAAPKAAVVPKPTATKKTAAPKTTPKKATPKKATPKKAPAVKPEARTPEKAVEKSVRPDRKVTVKKLPSDAEKPEK